MHELLASSEPDDHIPHAKAPQKKEKEPKVSKKVRIEEPEAFVEETLPAKKRQVKKVAALQPIIA